MTEFIYWLNQSAGHDREALGGKGANLLALTSAGFPVPAGFCLSTSAYHRFVQEAGLDDALTATVKDASVDDPRALESKAEAAQRLITSRPMPTEIASALEESYLRLAQMLSERDPAVAVRSSAIGEDQGRASFAGQYQSYLNVRGTDALIAHVQKCWSALWLPQALHYRLTRSEQNGSPAMAVVVQRLVPCTTSGVLFTANPLTGRRDEIVVNSAWGLAEVVVSGIVSPDTFVVDKETLAPREITLGQKDKVAQPLLAGGTTLIETPQEDRERASLSDSQLENLARMALAIESHFGAPQDIEWAFNDDSLFILQSRPITNLREQPSVGPFPIVWEREEDKKLWWTWDQIHYPRPLSPLYASIAHHNFGGRARGSEFFGGTTRGEMRILNGYRYSAQVPIDLSPEEIQERRTRGPQEMDQAIENVRERWEQQFLPEVIGHHRYMAEFDLAHAPTQELLAHLERSLVYWGRAMEIHTLAVSPAGQAARRFAQLFTQLTGIQDEREAYVLLQGFENKSLETHRGLWGLAQEVKSNPELVRCFRDEDSAKILSRLRKTPSAQSFMHNLMAYLDVFGTRFTDLGEDFFDPTWREAPEFVLSLIKGYLLPSAQDPWERHLMLAEEREQALKDAYQRIGPDEEKRTQFDKALKSAQIHLPIMEDHHYYLDHTSIAHVRFIFMEFGRRLTEKGVLDEPEDVLFLSMDEVKAATQSPVTLAHVVDERKRQREQWLKLSPLAGVGTPPTPGAGAFGYVPEAGHDDPRVLKGAASSAGRATGVARVVLTPQEINRIQPGDILVCQSILPQWSTLFNFVAGVVTNAGSPLQHGAILAREYRIPLVDGTWYGTHMIKDGQTITVDGAAGLVYLDGS